MDSIIKTKKVPDYSLGKIYKITSPNCDEVYIGSTTQTLKDRLSEHKSACKTKNINSKVVIDKGDAVIELIEDFPCESKKELERREGEIMKTTLNCCNKLIAGRTMKEWRDENTERIAKQQKQYYIENTTTIAERAKQYRIDNAELIAIQKKQYAIDNAIIIAQYQTQYRIDNLVELAKQQKQYAINNAVKIAEYQKQYAVDNAIIIAEYKRQYYLKKKQKLNLIA